jgi:putative iron-regulated protein
MRLTLKTARNLVIPALFAVAIIAPIATTAGAQPSLPLKTVAASVEFTDRQIIVDFADQVVIPTFESVANRADALSAALDAFTKTPNPQTLKTARSAWIAARFAWEQTECFGFGPIKSEGYDANFDSWPIDQNDLAAILASGDQITPGYIERLQGSTKGFHLIEYLLFGEDSRKAATGFSPRELTFLQHLGGDFAQVAHRMAASWTQGSADKPAYRQILVTAGAADNHAYPTLAAAAQEMVGGMVESLTEVADKKLGEPFEKKDPKLAESRFSLNTLADIQSNLQGSENVYLGRVANAQFANAQFANAQFANAQFANAQTKSAQAGLSRFVAQRHPELDTKVKQQFQAARSALAKIPQPFETAVLAPQAAEAIREARSAISSLQETLDKEVKPLLGSR